MAHVEWAVVSGEGNERRIAFKGGKVACKRFIKDNGIENARIILSRYHSCKLV